MPRYDYKCKECGHVFEFIKKMADPRPPCLKCRGEVEVQLAPTPAIFKGEGWTPRDLARRQARGIPDDIPESTKEDQEAQFGKGRTQYLDPDQDPN
jgi:putative FmdB family regulatory protein